jgi:hypothetical protein
MPELVVVAYNLFNIQVGVFNPFMPRASDPVYCRPHHRQYVERRIVSPERKNAVMPLLFDAESMLGTSILA